MPSRQVALAILLATLAAVFLWTRVFVSIDLARTKIVQEPRASVVGSVSVDVSNGPDVAKLTPPFALVAQITNQTGADNAFTVVVDGTPACRKSVEQGGPRRIDCAVTGGWGGMDAHNIRIEGPSGSWSLDYLELATHHGRTTGATEAVVLPAGFDRYAGPAVPWVIATWLFVAWCLSTFPNANMPKALRLSYGILAVVILALFAAVFASPLISEYRLVLSAGTFTRWTALLLAPRLWPAGRWLCERDAAGTRSRWSAFYRPLIVSLLVLAGYAAVTHAIIYDSYHGNYSGILRISQERFDKNPILNSREDVRRSLVLADTGGYDAQFAYFETFDPFLRVYRAEPGMYRNFIDAPPYRYARIGYTLLAWLVTGGRWEWMPATMIWMVLLGTGAVALLMALLAVEHNVSAAAGALALLNPGFWQSIQVGLPEPIAAAFLLGGMLAVGRRRWIVAAVLFSASLLVRETGIVAIACVLAGAAVAQRRWQPALSVGACAVFVLLLWRAYVAWMLFQDQGFSGFTFHPNDLGWPFAGFIDLWREVIQGRYFDGQPEMARAAIAFPLLLTGAFILAVALARHTLTAAAAAAVVYGLIAISLNLEAIWVHVGNGQRGTYELFLMLAVATLGIRQYSVRVRYGLIALWGGAALYLLVLGFDATYIRQVLLPLPL